MKVDGRTNPKKANRSYTGYPELLPGEEFRKLVFYDTETHRYSVSNYGRLFCHMRKKGRGKGMGKGTTHVYDPNYWLEVIWTAEKETKTYKDGSTYTKFNNFYTKATLDKGIFDDSPLVGRYDFHSNASDTFNKRITKHQAIMWTFRPWGEHPPEGIPLEKAKALKEWCPEIYEYCIMAGTINHINHQPEHDNYVCIEDTSKDKIEYVTPVENTQKAKAHYGGSTELARKKFLSGEHDNIKPKDEPIIFGEPVYRPLFQDYKVDIEFNGEEGMEISKFLHYQAEKHGMPFEDVFRETMVDGFISAEKEAVEEIYNKDASELTEHERMGLWAFLMRDATGQYDDTTEICGEGSEDPSNGGNA